MARSAHPLRSVSFAAASALMLCSASAEARNWSKSDAILGGQPSALQAIMAQQQGQPAPIPAPLRPASFSKVPLTRAVVTEERATWAPVSSDQPDVFGSVALRIGTTRLNARWNQVERARLVGTSARYASGLSNLDEVEQLEAVNRYVNARVQFVEDDRQYGRADVWTTAADTLSRGRGDCEDYAVAKFQMLRRAGFKDRDLYLVIVKDLVSRRDHAVLVVRAAGRMYVLDNGTDRLLDSAEIRDYRPILTFAAGGTWTHGYRMISAPVEVASTSDAEQQLPTFAEAAPQRSWSASSLAFNTGLSR